MFKINSKLLPIKAHYFFFMAAMGPILPQINVYGKQLGIAPDVMGFITSILPILYIIAKPLVGYLADYFSNHRKMIFMSVIGVMTICYAGFYFIPSHDHNISTDTDYNVTMYSNELRSCFQNETTTDSVRRVFRAVSCSYMCNDHAEIRIVNRSDNRITGYISRYYQHQENDTIGRINFCSALNLVDIREDNPFKCDFNCDVDLSMANNSLYSSATFYGFVVLMCLGTIGFNVANCISDAVCFDMLGELETMKYGAQRVWGTIGFGLTALIAGIAVDVYTDGVVKSIAPALVVMVIFSGFDLLSVTKLKLPALSTTDSIYKDVRKLLKRTDIVIFLVFATIAGIIDSFIIYYMFWHLEEVAAETGYTESIKLIEGCVVAAECLGGEILFFLISGKILRRIGYVHCLSMCFFTYSIRLALISLIPNPWYLVPIELVMQGATYALCYTCIVAYASAVAPPGTSATVQGLVAGMDDGVGFAIGSLIGGQMYKRFGGAVSFRFFAGGALIACFAHIMLRPAAKHHTHIASKGDYEIPVKQSSVDLE